MALTKRISVGHDFTFGIAPGTAKPTGLTSITSVDASQEYSTNVTAMGEDGDVAAHLYGNAKNSITMEGYTTATDVPVLGSAVVYAGLHAATMGITLKSSNEDFVKISVKAEGYAAITYT